MAVEHRRYIVISPDRRSVSGYDNPQGAEAAALGFGDGSHVMDTLSATYQPALQVVEDGQLCLLGHGAFNRRDGFDVNLIEAAKKGVVPAVIAFLARGASAQAADSFGGTALHWAVAKGNEEVVQILLVAGADPGRADHSGKTALALAEEKNRREIAEMLASWGLKRAATVP